jgi:hypothetical protein
MPVHRTRSATRPRKNVVRRRKPRLAARRKRPKLAVRRKKPRLAARRKRLRLLARVTAKNVPSARPLAARLVARTARTRDSARRIARNNFLTLQNSFLKKCTAEPRCALFHL